MMIIRRGSVLHAYLKTRLIRTVARFLPNCHSRHRIGSANSANTAWLTFEDGPDPDSTPELLDLLDQHGLKATFFLIGERAARHPDLVAEIVDRGHTVGNHTFSHHDTWKMSTLQAIREIRECSRMIDTITGSMPGWWRPPQGHVTGKLVAWCERHDMHTALWDIAVPNATSRHRVREIEQTIEANIRPGSIITLHDCPASSSATLAALDHSLPRLLNQSWQFEPLSKAA